MNLEKALRDFANRNLETGFEIVEMEKDVEVCFDCVWSEGDVEKRVRIREQDGELPEVLYCSDYVDERNKFGTLVLNQRIDSDSVEEHVEIAFSRMFDFLAGAEDSSVVS